MPGSGPGLDAAELADWPMEASQGPKTASGEPILHGAETMFVHSGDVFNSWGGPTSGVYMGWSFYFLDFAESNNMVYVHVEHPERDRVPEVQPDRCL